MGNEGSSYSKREKLSFQMQTANFMTNFCHYHVDQWSTCALSKMQFSSWSLTRRLSERCKGEMRMLVDDRQSVETRL